MSNLVNVVAQLRKQRDEAQKTVEQLDHALATLDGVDGSRSRGKSSEKLGKIEKNWKNSPNYVSRCQEKNGRGATCAPGEAESRSAASVKGR